jgi:hypothetical protein
MTDDRPKGTINGTPIIESRIDSNTGGTKMHVTSDGRLWTELKGNAVPNTIATGTIFGTIRYR